MDFVAIDFETANPRRASACSLGMIKVRDGQVVDSYESLIRPAPSFDYVTPYNQKIHGISIEQIAEAPTMSELWPEIREFLGENPVIAHNLDFDLDVFRKSLSAWNLEFIDATFGCTLRLAQTALPKLPTFNLHYLSVELNLSPFNHHDALADAETCAEVALKLATTNPRWLEIGNWPKSGLTKSAINQAPSTGELYDTALRFVGHEQNRVKGKLFTFTGTMHLVRHREDIDPVLNALGAGRLETTGKKTDYLVVGDEDIRMFAPGKSHSRKYEKAFDLRAAGQEIEIISEQEFRRMLPGELVEQLLRIR